MQINLISIVNKEAEDKAPLSQIKVLPFKERKNNLSAKYNIGKKLDDKKETSEEVSDASKPV